LQSSPHVGSRGIIASELKQRTVWFVRLRWFVPPCIALCALAARTIGFELETLAIILISILILAYNIFFKVYSRSIGKDPVEEVRRFAYLQVGFDYAAMFLLIHFTGGVASPLLFFFIFHIVFATILLPVRSAYVFAGLVAAGMILIAILEYLGLISRHAIAFGPETIGLAKQPYQIAMVLAFLTATLFITAFSAGAIMSILKERIIALARSSQAIKALNEKLHALYIVNEAVISKQRLAQVLDIAKDELLKVMNVKAASVKLLSSDGSTLRYAAASGLPDDVVKKEAIQLSKSLFNQRIIQGEPFVTGDISKSEMFQFGQDLAASGLKSVLFVPLKVKDKVIGILGAYCTEDGRFTDEDVEFFRLAAGFVAIAIENARAYEEIESMGEERSRLMLRVAHNLRAPLAATIGMVDILRSDYLGSLNESQSEYLRRVDRRARTLASMINELMALAKSRNRKREILRVPVSLKFIAGRISRTFKGEAERKNLEFSVTIAKDLPDILGDPGIVEQIMENLVSNAIKYTKKGKVEVDFSLQDEKSIRIEVKDTGIGIPKDAIPELFTEFFRAENARSIEEFGTGLGLAMVKETVEHHGGRIEMETEENQGTTFIVYFPIEKTEETR
jgi:signal transduction histidine kinase